MGRLFPHSRSIPVLPLSAALVLLLIVVDALAVAGIVGTRRAARQAAVEQLQRRAEVQARGYEAALATLRADLLFLSSSPRLAESWERSRSVEPMARRWGRLETESTLLQFMEGHPGLVSLTVKRGADETGVVRSASGAPTVMGEWRPTSEWALELDLPLAADLRLLATVDPARLLAALTPGLGGALVLESATVTHEDELAVLEPIDTRGWKVAAPVMLERREEPGQLVGTVETLASRYRTTVLLNVVVLLLAIPLGLLAVREARRAERLASANEHERERRQMERRLWHQERLATVGRLTADLAHEINNPLAGVSNHLALLEEELSTGQLNEAQLRMPKLRHGIERITQTVRRSLRLATPGRAEREPVDLHTVVADSVALIADQSGGVRLLLPAGDSEPVVVVGEAAALIQVVTNLILNAIQIQDEGGEVSVAVGVDSGMARLEVLDRGPGIAHEVAARLFEPFVSGRGSTGLGLSVCEGIVREHGGRLVAENRTGGGARFVVELPVAHSVEEAS